jgi:hypothetical protein
MNERAPDQGRIAFRIRIGVTGHRDLTAHETAAVLPVLRREIERIRALAPATDETPVALAVVSSLADGADRLVVREVFRHGAERAQDVLLDPVLPLERLLFAETQRFSAESRDEYDRLLAPATPIWEPPAGFDVPLDEALAIAARRLVERCDVLVALWRGDPSGGAGGTADTLSYAAWRRKPCIWIQIGDDPEARNNFSRPDVDAFWRDIFALARKSPPADPAPCPCDVLASLKDVHRNFVALNSPSMREGFIRRAVDEFQCEEDAWPAAQFARAAEVADGSERCFKRLAFGISAMAVAASAALAYTVQDRHHQWVAGIEAVLLAGAMVALRYVRRHEVRARWVSCRALAERLRTAHFVVPVRTRDRPLPMPKRGFQWHADDWVSRAFEEVYAYRPPSLDAATRPASTIAPSRDRIAAEWTARQVAFYRRGARISSRWYRWLTRVAEVLFGVAIASAIVHALGHLERATISTSVIASALGAALGAYTSVMQHRAVGARYDRMACDLAHRCAAISTTVAWDGLAVECSDAALSVAEENGDWLGAMWFLEIEHI